MTLIIIELLSCLSAISTSFLYEGKALLLLGQEKYKIKLGCLKEYNEVLKSSFFPIMNKNANKLRFYIDYLIFLIPVVNFVYSLVKGNIKCNNIIKILKSKDIIIAMNEEEKDFYNEIENKIEMINFVLFNSMDSYKKGEWKLVNNTKENSSYQTNEYNNQIENDLTECYSPREEQHQKDVSYLVSMFEFQNEKEENKVKKLKL